MDEVDLAENISFECLKLIQPNVIFDCVYIDEKFLNRSIHLNSKQIRVNLN